MLCRTGPFTYLEDDPNAAIGVIVNPVYSAIGSDPQDMYDPIPEVIDLSRTHPTSHLMNTSLITVHYSGFFPHP